MSTSLLIYLALAYSIGLVAADQGTCVLSNPSFTGTIGPFHWQHNIELFDAANFKYDVQLQDFVQDTNMLSVFISVGNQKINLYNRDINFEQDFFYGPGASANGHICPPSDYVVIAYASQTAYTSTVTGAANCVATTCGQVSADSTASASDQSSSSASTTSSVSLISVSPTASHSGLVSASIVASSSVSPSASHSGTVSASSVASTLSPANAVSTSSVASTLSSVNAVTSAVASTSHSSALSSSAERANTTQTKASSAVQTSSGHASGNTITNTHSHATYSPSMPSAVSSPEFGYFSANNRSRYSIPVSTSASHRSRVSGSGSSYSTRLWTLSSANFSTLTTETYSSLGSSPSDHVSISSAVFPEVPRSGNSTNNSTEESQSRQFGFAFATYSSVTFSTEASSTSSIRVSSQGMGSHLGLCQGLAGAAFLSMLLL